MNYELKYADLMEQNGLDVSDLPQDAQVGIQQITEVMNLVRSNIRRGRNVSDKTISKVMAMDKWVCREIVDFVNETDNNEDDMPYSVDEVEEDFDDDNTPDEDDEDESTDEDSQEDDEEYDEDEEEDEDDDKVVEEEEDEAEPDSETGNKIDNDLKIAYNNGKTKITLDELKNVSITAYNIIFDSYDDSGDNGIITSNFSLLETDDYVFTLTKN